MQDGINQPLCLIRQISWLRLDHGSNQSIPLFQLSLAFSHERIISIYVDTLMRIEHSYVLDASVANVPRMTTDLENAPSFHLLIVKQRPVDKCNPQFGHRNPDATVGHETRTAFWHSILLQGNETQLFHLCILSSTSDVDDNGSPGITDDLVDYLRHVLGWRVDKTETANTPVHVERSI